jgi:hypothetical protein
VSATATYDPDLARVQIEASTWGATVAYATVIRYDNPQLTNGVVVRGGARVPISTGQTLRLDDYEFTDGELNTYRVRAYNASDVEVPTYSYTATITPVLDQVWLKSIARPFLNRPVEVFEYSDVALPGRGAVFEVLGRRLPVAVNEVRGSRRFEVTLLARTDEDVEDLELFLSYGDTVFLQPPADSPVPGPLYAQVGDVVRTKGGRHQMQRRYYNLPLTEVAAPDANVVGYTATWTGIVAAYATWSSLVAAQPTWLDVSQYVSAPSDEVVG